MRSITEKLIELRVRDKEFTVFGSYLHRYELNAALSEEEALRIEEKYRFALPEDYRWFMTNMGNGGAGPFYGIFPLGMNDDGHALASWEKGGLVGALDEPFQHAEAWNLPSSFWEAEPDPEGVSESEEDRLWEAWDRKLEHEYWNPSVMQGAIPICHEGCALRDWLVVCGPSTGNIWRDMRADNEGIALLKDAKGAPMSFSDWYISWLHACLNEVSSTNA